MQNFIQYIQYFENVARGLVEIAHTNEDKHFVSVGPEELFEGLRSTFKGTLLLLEDSNTVPINIDDSEYNGIRGAFSILKYLGANHKYSEENISVNWAEGLCKQVLVKMKADISIGNGIKKQSKFNTSDCEFIPMRNWPIGWYGMRCEFYIQVPTALCEDNTAYFPAFSTVKNSDNTWNIQVTTGTITTIPDEDITVNSLPFIRKPSVKNQDILLKNTLGDAITPIINGNELIIDQSANNLSVSNSDDTYDELINLDLELPDENITVNGVSFITKPSVKDQDITLVDQDSNILVPTLSASTIEVNTGYQRPIEWIAMPAALEKTIFALYLVFENDVNNNRITVSSNTANAGFWDFENDGTEVAFINGNTNYNYDYNTIGGAVNVYTEDGTNRNYKQVIFKVRFTGTLATKIDLNETPSKNDTTFADILCDFNNCEGILSASNLRYLRILTVTRYGLTPNESLNFLENNEYKLFNLPTPILSRSNAFRNSSFTEPLGNITGAQGSFSGVRAPSIGDITLDSTTLQDCKIKFCNNITNSGNTIGIPSAFFRADINIVGTIATQSSNMARAFQGCTTRKLIFTEIAPQPLNTTTQGGFLTGMPNLEELIMPGFQLGFDITGSRMPDTALNALFTSLGTAAGSQTITVTGNLGAATCDTTIATAKGFTVII